MVTAGETLITGKSAMRVHSSGIQDQVTEILKELVFQEIQLLSLSLSVSVCLSLSLRLSLSVSPHTHTNRHTHPPSLVGCKRRCFCIPELPLSCLPRLLDGRRKLRQQPFARLPGRAVHDQGRAGSRVGGRRAELTPLGADSSIFGQASLECVRRSSCLLGSLQSLNARARQALLC